MKSHLTLKSMLIATLCCVLITAVDLFRGSYVSPKDFKALLYWIIVLVGWAVYFLDLYRMRGKNEDDKEAG